MRRHRIPKGKSGEKRLDRLKRKWKVTESFQWYAIQVHTELYLCRQLMVTLVAHWTNLIRINKQILFKWMNEWSRRFHGPSGGDATYFTIGSTVFMPARARGTHKFRRQHYSPHFRICNGIICAIFHSFDALATTATTGDVVVLASNRLILCSSFLTRRLKCIYKFPQDEDENLSAQNAH